MLLELSVRAMTGVRHLQNLCWSLYVILDENKMIFQGFLFTQISGHSLIKILEVLAISKLQDNFCIYLCEFYMPFMHMRPKCPCTKFEQQKPCICIQIELQVDSY